jgi:hypothetical protein
MALTDFASPRAHGGDSRFRRNLGELERGSASTRPHRVFRSDQTHCPARQEGDLDDASLACGTRIAFANAIPGRQFQWRLVPVIVRAGHTTRNSGGHNTIVVVPPLASVVLKNHSIS